VITLGDATLLIVENDLAFARVLLDTARERGFKGLVSTHGAGALTLAREFNPTAMTLDIFLPDMEGWRVLDRLKHDMTTRHIPVCVISTDDSRARALASGALGFVGKPIQSKDLLDRALGKVYETVRRQTKSLLVAMPAGVVQMRVMALLEAPDLEIVSADDAAGALRVLAERRVDCLLLDPALDLDPASVADVVAKHGSLGQLPVLLYADGGAPSAGSDWAVAKDDCLVREVRSRERLVDQVAFYLHRPMSRLSPEQHRTLTELHESDKVVTGRKVLVVDDDVRNIFALATVLEEHGMIVVPADNGRAALDILGTDREVDAVLMDIMMPEMDGMTTIREARKLPGCHDLPIIAVTAKAMKGDREKCIEAGAWDYLSKPVDPGHMMSVLRAWLHR
jgi:CheY-like chemotaxis protein